MTKRRLIPIRSSGKISHFDCSVEAWAREAELTRQKLLLLTS